MTLNKIKEAEEKLIELSYRPRGEKGNFYRKTLACAVSLIAEGRDPMEAVGRSRVQLLNMVTEELSVVLTLPVHVQTTFSYDTTDELFYRCSSTIDVVLAKGE